jgi:hypothetical protein
MSCGSTLPKVITSVAVSGPSLPGYEQIIFVAKTTNPIEDGSLENPFHTVGSAIAEANGRTPTSTNRICIYIYPGTYDESGLIVGDYIYIQGANAESVVIRHSSLIMSFTGDYSSCRDITLQALSTNPILSLIGPSSDSISLEDSMFLGAGDDGNAIQATTGSWAIFRNCILRQTNVALNILTLDTDVDNDIQLIQCSVTGDINVDGGNLELDRTSALSSLTVNNASHFHLNESYFSNPVGDTINVNTTGTIAIIDCVVSTIGYVNPDNFRSLNITAAPSTAILRNSHFTYTGTATDYGVYSSVPFEFVGSGNYFRRGCNLNVRNTDIHLKDVGVGDGYSYNNIIDAVGASVSGDVIEIHPGTYTEQVTAKTGVILLGIERDSCIIQNTGADTSTYPLAASGVEAWNVQNLTIRTSVLSAVIHSFGTSSGTALTHWFKNVKFSQGQFREGECTSRLTIEFKECIFEGDDSGFYFVGSKSGLGPFVVFDNCKIDCSPEISSTHVTNLHNLIFEDTEEINIVLEDGRNLIAEYAGTSDILLSGSGVVSVKNDSLVYDGERISISGDWSFNGSESFLAAGARFIYSSSKGEFTSRNCIYRGGLDFGSNPFQTILENNTFTGMSFNDADITASTTVTGVLYKGNVQYNGIDGEIQILNKNKRIGGKTDSYRTLQEGILSLDRDDCRIVLEQDTVLYSELTLPSYRVLIDGLGRFSISRSSGGILLTVGANDDLTFIGIELAGKIEVNGNNNSLAFLDHTNLSGIIDLVSGNSGTYISIKQSEIFGDVYSHYCISVAAVNPVVIVDKSYLQGDVGYPAIYWNAAQNHNVKLAYSTILHGSSGVNLPFGQGGELSTLYFTSHHNAYNEDPEGSGDWVNVISPGHRFDSMQNAVAVPSEAPPEILTLQFSGDYPGSQTELKAGDTFQIIGTTDVPCHGVKILGPGIYADSACVEETFAFVADTQFSISGTIADQGTTAVLRPSYLQARDVSGLYGGVRSTNEGGGGVDKVNVVRCNNRYPTLTFGTITYPLTQGALKGSETATVAVSSSDVDLITYTSPTSELSITNPFTDESLKTVQRISGTYNDSTNNLRAIIQRLANAAQATVEEVVVIANVASSISVYEPLVRLLSGGENGSFEQDHTITLIMDQLVQSASVDADTGGGIFQGAWGGSGYSRQRALRISDSLTKGVYTWQNPQVLNLSGLTTTSITGDTIYTIGGFVTHRIFFSSFARMSWIGTNVSNVSKLQCVDIGEQSFSYEGVKRDDGDNTYTIVDSGGNLDSNGDYIYINDKAWCDQNSSGDAYVDLLEEA